MRPTVKFWVRAAAIVAVLALLCALCFLAVEGDHDCAGEDCLICQLLTLCRGLLGDLRLHAAAALFFAAALLFTLFGNRAAALRRSVTPIGLKVKLSD